MKFFKKTVLFLLVISFVVAVVGCGQSSESGDSFTLNYFLGGYGRQYIEALAKDYEELTGVKVRLKQSGSNDDAKNKIMAGTGDDMYLANTDFFGLQAYLANLNDLYEMEVYGEPGVKVKDKIDPRMLEYYKEDGGYYQVSENVMTGFNWVYNKTLLDQTFPDGYQLPRTTDEFFEFGDKLFEKGIFLFTTALGGKAYEDYTEYAWRTFLMQMMGNEGYENFYNGYYKEGDEWVRSLESPDPLFDANATAIEQTYEVVRRLCQPTTISGEEVQYIHKRSSVLGFKDVDVMFYGGKINGVQLQPTAFIFTGVWLEREVLPYIEAGVVDITEQQAMPMRAPVMSAIITRTPSIAKQTDPEQTLRDVVSYIDAGETGTAPAGVTAEDIAIVSEARRAVPKGIEDSILITNYSRKIDLCKDFVTYLVSDRAQKIAAQNASGIPVLPYGYEPTEEDMCFEISAFTKEFFRLADDAVLVDMSHGNKPFAKTIGMVWYADNTRLGNDRLTKALFYKENPPAKNEIVASTKSQFRVGWENLIETFYEKYGEDA